MDRTAGRAGWSVTSYSVCLSPRLWRGGQLGGHRNRRGPAAVQVRGTREWGSVCPWTYREVVRLETHFGSRMDNVCSWTDVRKKDGPSRAPSF